MFPQASVVGKNTAQRRARGTPAKAKYEFILCMTCKQIKKQLALKHIRKVCIFMSYVKLNKNLMYKWIEKSGLTLFGVK
jgi:hypothetical protein